MGGFAWVTLATNDSYSLGALVLAHSLKQVGTTKQLAVLITPGVTSAMREKLASVFNVIHEVNILDSKDEANLRLLKRPELGVTFTKLHCWRLTQFDKCVFLDADTLVLQNCDELFDREELSAAPDVGWPDCFNSGVFVYRPSNETYDKLVQFALDKGSFDGGDQGLLNLYFSDWSTKDIGKHLPFIYNLCSTACYSYLPAFKQFGALAKIIHFIGSSKPWLQYFNTETRKVQPSGDLTHLERVLQHWWDIFCSLIHPKLTPEMSGLAGAFAQLTLGAPRTAEQSALDDHLRRQGWEVGNIDYLGRDSFDNIWSKICQTLSAGPTAPTPTPEPEANVELPKQEIPPPAPVIAPQETIKDSSVTPTESVVPQVPQSTISEQPKEVPSLPTKEIVCTLPPKPQEPPADTANEISVAEASSPKEVVQLEASDLVAQTTAAPTVPATAPTIPATAPTIPATAPTVPATSPLQDTPAPVQETPAPVQETPAPVQETPATVQETPALVPLQEAAAAPQETPAPLQEPHVPLQAIAAPPQEKSLPPQETPASPQVSSVPPQETPPTKQDTPAPPQTPAPAQEVPLPVQQTLASVQASPPPQEKTPRPPQVTPEVSSTPPPEICPLLSKVPPVGAQPPTIPTPEPPPLPPTTIASQEAAPPTTPSKETVTSPPEVLQKSLEPLRAPPKEVAPEPVASAPQSAPQEIPKTPEVLSTPQPVVPPEAEQAVATPQAAPPAEAPKGKTKAAKEGTEQPKQSSAQGATAASPTPPPRKGAPGGKKTKSKK